MARQLKTRYHFPQRVYSSRYATTAYDTPSVWLQWKDDDGREHRLRMTDEQALTIARNIISKVPHNA